MDTDITAAINSILDVTKSNQDHQPEIRHALQVAIDRNERLNQFMKNFADVIRIPEPHLEKVNINQLIQSVAGILQFKANALHIRFEFDLTIKPIWVSLDINQMEQVLINIIKNALESIQQKITSPGNLELVGKIKFITSEQPAYLVVEDNGMGIPKETADLLFTPFYSSKRDGQGIGLTIIREILNSHGFKFSLKSVDEATTRFQIFFNLATIPSSQ